MTIQQQETKEGSGSTAQSSRERYLAKEDALRRQAEHFAEQARLLWHKAADKMRKPPVGATIAGVAVLAAGAVWGASEAAIAAVAAYAVFRMLRKRVRSERSSDKRDEGMREQPTSAPAT
jgi:hypothetical protein